MVILRLQALFILLLMALSSVASDNVPAPRLHHLTDIHARIGTPYVEGESESGRMIAIPITGGELKGRLSGRILPGGADHQTIDTVCNRTALCALYEVETPDSVIIKVRNEGIITGEASDYYFMTSPKFECERDSRYAWLMDRIFVCRPIEFLADGIVLRVWEVR